MGNRLRTWAIATSLLFGMVGCTALLPVPDSSDMLTDDKHGITRQVGELTATVRVTGWRPEPLYRLEQLVTPLYVELRNNGTTPVLFDLKNIVLVDDEGTLYRPVPPARLEGMLSGPSAPPVGPGVQLDPSLYPYDTDFAATLGALTSGPVEPGTQIRGAVYFQRAVAARELTLRLTVGEDTQSFRFRVR